MLFKYQARKAGTSFRGREKSSQHIGHCNADLLGRFSEYLYRAAMRQQLAQDLALDASHTSIFFESLPLSPLDLLIDSTPIGRIYCLDITPHALIKLSVYPANSVCPSALHAKLTHSGSLLFLPTAVYSGFNSSTLLFFSRSKMMMELDVAAHSQYRFGENTKAWISSPAVRE